MPMSHSKPRTVLAALLLLWAAPAVAQPSERFEAAVHVAAASMPHFEGSDFGVGARLAWRADDLLTWEGELTFFPGEYPDSPVAFSRRRVEGLFGLTAGVRIGMLRPFAKFRAGFLDVQQAAQPFACILIFPPPLACLMAAGQTMPAVEIGGGVQVDVASRTFARADIAGRWLRYPGPSFRSVPTVREEEEFWGSGVRLSFSAGMRF